MMWRWRETKFLILVCGFLIFGQSPVFSRADILEGVLSAEEEHQKITDKNTGQILTLEQQTAIELQKQHIAENMRKMLMRCTSYKRGAMQGRQGDSLSEWPGLRGLCLPAGEINLEEKRRAAERAVFSYCKDTLVPEYCDSFGIFKKYCKEELLLACLLRWVFSESACFLGRGLLG